MPVLSLVMDGLLLLFLAGTMIFAWRLSRSLNAFMRSRRDLDKLVGDLGRNIEKAERAIGGLQNSARDSGSQLQTLIDRATAISEELQMVMESSHRAPRRSDRLENSGPEKRSDPPRAARQAPAMSPPAFAIRDREVEEGGDGALAQDEEFTKAERELMAALRMGGK